MQNLKGSTKGHTKAVPFPYSPDATSDKARKAFKDKSLKESPETLFADLYKTGNDSNLILFTDQPLAWHSAISALYPSAKKEGLPNGWKIEIEDTNNSDAPTMTVTFYKTGIVMVQGNHELFEMDFLRIKERAQQEKGSSTDTSQTLSNDTCSQATKQPLKEEEPASPEQPQDPELNLTITNLKVKFTDLDRDLVNLRELISQQPCPPSTAGPDLCTQLDLLRTKVQRLQQDMERDVAALTEEVKELQGEREEHRRALTSLTEEVKELQGEREGNTAAH